MKGAERPETQGAQTARRTLRLLEALADHPPHRLVDLTAEVGLTKSTTYRLLRVLEDEGYAQRNQGGGYRPGPSFTGLATLAMPHAHLHALARSTLIELAELSGETVTLHERAGDFAVLVFGIETQRHALRQAARIGETTTLTSGCAGQVILASLPAQTRNAILLRAAPAQAQRDVLRNELADIAARGYAISHGINHPGVRAIAAPVRTPRGDALSIAVAGPADRWSEARAQQLGPQLTVACQALEHRLVD